MSERYRDLELIAEGGMGEVFRATMVSDAGVEKPVALKLLRSEVDAGFLEEAKIAMAMSHGNIVQTFDAGHREGRPFLAMELVEGTDLTTLIARGPIPPQHALTIAVEALRGLEYAHRLRGESGPLDLVHRDISPANLLVSREGEVKIADFGIARAAAERQVESGVRGKLAYMAPEQLMGGAVDARADLWAMGVVLYEMLTGARPFDADDADELRARIRANAANIDRLPESLREVVRGALRRDAADRYASAAQMREAIEDAARAAELRISTSALRDWISGPSEQQGAGDFDARLGALLGGDARTGTVEVAPERVDAEPPSSTRSYTALVVLALLVAAAMPFVGFAFDEDRPDRHAAAEGDPHSVVQHGEDPHLQRGEDPHQSPSSEAASELEDPPPVVSQERMVSRMQERRGRPEVMREPPTEEPAEMGPTTNAAELWIASDPWAYVSIDGTRVGRTTLRRHSVAAGRHVVLLSNPSAGLQRRIELELAPGERKRLSVSLDP